MFRNNSIISKMDGQLTGNLVSSVLTFPKALEMWERKTKFYNPENIVKELGRGCGGIVYLCKGNICAKVMSGIEDEKFCAELAEEFNILCLVWFSSPEEKRKCFLEPLYIEIYKDSLVIGIEYFDGRTLAEICEFDKNSFSSGSDLALDLCTTMEHLNNLSIFHEDFGLHNVMISSDFSRLRVIDYGLVFILDGPKKFVSHYEYTTPEELKEEREIHTEQEMKNIQIWGMGMVLLAMKFGISRHDFGEGEEVLSLSCLTRYVNSFQLSEDKFIDRAIKSALSEDTNKRCILLE